MAGIPAIAEYTDTEVIFFWRGQFAADPVTKLAAYLDVLGTAQKFFLRSGDKKFSFRVRLQYGDESLHVHWVYRNSRAGAELVKVTAALKRECGYRTVDVLQAWDGIKLTHGLTRRSVEEWQAASRISEIMEAITVSPEALLGCIIDITR